MKNFDLPKKATLIEVGPRDGFQFESKIVPTELKAEIVSGLVDAGIKQIQAVSFVHPKKVPQMADAEELLKLLPRKDGVVYNGLVLNAKGVERAAAAGLKHVEVSISSSDAHSRQNAGMSLSEAVSQAEKMIAAAKSRGMHIRAGVQCSFGCLYDGEIGPEEVLRIIEGYLEQGVDVICLSDTTGMATPTKLDRILEKAIPMAGDVPVMLHLHDTRGLGLVNVMTALSHGITIFDTSLGGMGGCPFVPGASGNIATEDFVYLMETLGIETGVDKTKVAECSKKISDFLGKPLSGKMYKLLPEHCPDEHCTSAEPD